MQFLIVVLLHIWADVEIVDVNFAQILLQQGIKVVGGDADCLELAKVCSALFQGGLTGYYSALHILFKRKVCWQASTVCPEHTRPPSHATALPARGRTCPTGPGPVVVMPGLRADNSNIKYILLVFLSRGLSERRRLFPGQGGPGQGEERAETSKTANATWQNK